jgi:uncharacterized protein YdaL
MDAFEREKDTTLLVQSYNFDETAHAQYLYNKFVIIDWDATMSQFYIPDLINILLNNTTEPLQIAAHPTMYLQRQNGLACWMHAFCAVIGFSFPGNCLTNDWIAALFYGFPASRNVVPLDTIVVNEMQFLDATDIYNSPLNKNDVQQGLQRFQSILKANKEGMYCAAVGMSGVSIFIYYYNALILKFES